MKRTSNWSCFALAAFLLTVFLPLSTPTAGAQTGVAGSGKIHGVVTDPSGAPRGDGTVSLYPSTGAGITAGEEAKYDLPVDANGNYKGDNVAAGTYSIIYREPSTPKNQVVDQIDEVKVTAGQDTEANIDMSRPAYIAKLTPEQRKALEEAQKKNAAIMKENAQIKNLNADLKTARDDDRKKDFADAAALMQKDASLKPDAAVLWVELGLAQAGLKQCSDAETALQKGIALDAAAKKPDPELEGAANDKLGECNVTDGKIPDGEAAYDAAAKVNPAGAGMYYENETIMMDRVGATNPTAQDAIVTAADKAIAADPNRPIPYYLKARALVAKATVDQKTGKIVAPPGCLEAYQKYIDLAPNGQFVADAKAVIAEMSQTQATSYKAGRKH